jgi:hypothetical protein
MMPGAYSMTTKVRAYERCWDALEVKGHHRCLFGIDDFTLTPAPSDDADEPVQQANPTVGNEENICPQPVSTVNVLDHQTELSPLSSGSQEQLLFNENQVLHFYCQTQRPQIQEVASKQQQEIDHLKLQLEQEKVMRSRDLAIRDAHIQTLANLTEALVNQNGDKIDNPQDYSPLIATADKATTTTAATLDTTAPCTLDDTATTIEGSHKIYPHKYSYYKNREAVLRDLEKQKSHTIYRGTSRGARFYGAAAALNPQSSLQNMELTFALVQAALLADAGFDDVELEDFACSVPSAQSISEHVAKTATDSKFLAAKEILSAESKVF